MLRGPRDLNARPGGLKSLDPQQLYSDWLSLSLDCYTRLSDQYLNSVVGLAEDAVGHPPVSVAPTSHDAEIRASDARGQRLIVPFQLDNGTCEALSVSLAADDLLAPEAARSRGI